MLKAFAATVAVLALLMSSLWVWAEAPCSLWSWSRVGDMPTRCLLER
ncbi:hypothetical protein [Kitasatospora sp. MAA19]|nr:hypothetical protein [Kitasatospora sp. MAA19]